MKELDALEIKLKEMRAKGDKKAEELNTKQEYITKIQQEGPIEDMED